MTPTDTPKSAGELMSDILGNVSNLVRNEADLARAEVGESISKARASLVAMAVALVLAIPGLNMLAVALVAVAVAAGLPPPWAAAAVGAGLILVALIIFSMARSSLNQIGFLPTRAARSLQRDVAAVKDSFNDK